ncbi:hypothetical protein H310_11018 [Aphanomyces invadans]|uniref:Uncharacterized protein n=2 Tax=Aphanomyces invadans TaxID=157072 RepID=A0A024TPM1_9STRA|nr:hypothetical protein H310_11018 [Aphanomyces invadans]ETV95581.1 hypothetical protein H310_11018 [Aphanomyces invadans]|eukprot:XP_008875774.1 hypothetical protein H310_11018 [Aphanomyces invadans]
MDGASQVPSVLKSDYLRDDVNNVDQDELESLRRNIVELEREFLLGQVQAQVISDIEATSSLKSLTEHLANMNVTESWAVMLARKKQLWAACHEREIAVTQIKDTLDQIEVTRQTLQQAETDAKDIAVANAMARDEWKRLQKLNIQKKTVLEMAFNVQVNNEQSSAQLEEQLAAGVKNDQDRELALNDKLLEMTAKVQQARQTLDKLRQDASRQAGDVQVLEQAKKCANLNSMMQWYSEMQSLVEKLTGLRVLRVEATHFDVQVGAYEVRLVVDVDSLKLEKVQIIPPTLDITDLIEIAVDENDVPFLLRETLARAINMAQLQAHLDILAKEGVVCVQRGMDVSLTFGAPDDKVFVQVEVSSEYGQDHEWLRVRSIRPANDRLQTALNTTLQCRNLVDLIQEIVHQLLR